ncbi:hypothetical protein D3C75_1376120 [compost metagenome]
MLVFQPAAGQMAAYFILSKVGEFVPDIINRCNISCFNLLLEVSGIQIITQIGFTAVRRNYT